MDRDLSRSRAVLIGNGTYQNPEIEDLHAVRASLAGMEALLTGPLCGWSAERITTLLDVAAPHDLARQVHAAVNTAEDVLLVYYVGHGMRTSDGHLALAVGESDPRPELRSYTAMLYEGLARIMRGCRAATKLVILDCCHAELGNKANYVFQGTEDDLAEAYPVDGLYFIGASAKDARAKAPQDGTPTYFTAGLMDVVTTGIAGAAPMLRLDEIFRELHGRLVRADLPAPVESGMRGARQFRFAYNAAPVRSVSGALPEALRVALDSPYPQIRLAAVNTLGEWLSGGDPARTVTARLELRQIADDDAPTVASAAITLLNVPAAAVRPAQTAKPKPQPPTSAKPAPDSSVVRASSSAAGDPAASESRRSPLTGHTRPVSSLAFSPDGKTLASAGGDKTVRLWQVATGSTLRTLADHPAAVTTLGFSADGAFLAGAGNDSVITVWRPDRGQVHHVIRGHIASILTIAPSRDGRFLASGDGSGKLSLWNFAAGTHLDDLNGHTGPVKAVAFHADGQLLASAGVDKTIMLWSLIGGPGSRRFPEPTVHRGHSAAISALAFNPGGELLASAAYDMTVKLWDVDTGWPRRTLSDHTGAVNAVAFSPYGSLLATAGDDRHVRLWDPATGELRQTLEGHSMAVNAVAFSPDGRILASAGADMKIRLWEISYL